MFYIIHAILGCIIGSYFNSWVVVALVAFAAHFFFDMLPHWDGPYDKAHFEKTGNLKMHGIMPYIEGFDFIMAILIASYLVHISAVPTEIMVIGIAASLAPDVLKVGYFTPLKNNKLYMKYLQFHSKIQNEVGWKTGLAIQMITVILLLIALRWV
jgi:hypothetical protein